MPYREIFFEKNQPFHILSRTVEKRKIFSNKEDCYRFIFQLYAANIGRPAPNVWRKDVIKVAQALLHGDSISSKFIIKKHPPLVYILDFALVINHYHFCLMPNLENKVPLYMKKLNNGFAKYFNLKYERKGALFNGPYKSIAVKTDFQSDVVSRYISIINPLDVYQSNWRKRGLKDKRKAFEFLKKYQFSSFPDRMGQRRSKILAPKEILEKHFCYRDRNDYMQFVKDFLEEKLDFSRDILLE